MKTLPFVTCLLSALVGMQGCAKRTLMLHHNPDLLKRLEVAAPVPTPLDFGGRRLLLVLEDGVVPGPHGAFHQFDQALQSYVVPGAAQVVFEHAADILRDSNARVRRCYLPGSSRPPGDGGEDLPVGLAFQEVEYHLWRCSREEVCHLAEAVVDLELDGTVERVVVRVRTAEADDPWPVLARKLVQALHVRLVDGPAREGARS